MVVAVPRVTPRGSASGGFINQYTNSDYKSLTDLNDNKNLFIMLSRLNIISE